MHNGKIIQNKTEIANRFNKFFVNVGSTLANAIPHTDRKPTDYIKNGVLESFFLNPTTEEEIKEFKKKPAPITKKLKKKK